MEGFNLTKMLLYLSVMFPFSIAASCGDIVRLADLMQIIQNQTKLIEDQREIITSLTTGEYFKRKDAVYGTLQSSSESNIWSYIN